MVCRAEAMDRIRQGVNMRENQHELLVVSERDLFCFWVDLQVRRGGLSPQQADEVCEWYKTGIVPSDSKAREIVWTVAGQLAENYATGQSIVSVAKLLKDFGGVGRYVEKSYNGVNYIIFKGHAGLRSEFSGTRYRADNPKIISMGIGRLGVREAVKAGARLTIVLMGAYRITEYLLKDNVTLTRLIGSFAIDVAKICSAAVVGYIAGALVATGGVVSTGFVAGPLLASIIVGGGASLILDYIDRQSEFTERLVGQIEVAVETVVLAAKEPGYLVCLAREKVLSGVSVVLDDLIEQVKGIAIEKLRKVVGPFYYPTLQSLPR